MYINEAGKDGSPLLDKNGKNYKRVSIYTIEYPDGLSKICYPDSKYPSPELDMVVDQSYWLKVEMNGNYANFRIASKTDVLEARVEKLEKAVFKPTINTFVGYTHPVAPVVTTQATLTPKPTTSQPLNKKEVGNEPEYNLEEPLFDDNGNIIPF